MSCIVETKKEFTIQLVNILSPLIYEGINSIYSEAKKISKKNNTILKTFQSFLKKIPKWENDMIEQETVRIITSLDTTFDIVNLLKAIVKSNIQILTNNNNIVDKKLYDDLKLADFIHRVYIESAREFWNNPYLMYHVYEPIDLKRNQRESINIIKECIRESIRKMLPRKYILEKYLGDELEKELVNNNFNRIQSEQEERNLNRMVMNQLNQKYVGTPKPISKSENQSSNSESIESNSSLYSKKSKSPESNVTKTNDSKTVGSKILSIIGKTRDTKLEKISEKYSATEENKTDTVDNTLEKAMSNKYNVKVSESPKNNSDIDSKIKNILKNDLADSEMDNMESSVYRLEKNPDNYEEIFSNSVEVKTNNVINSTDRRKNLDRNKFFANYLKV
tara:strand:+ start:527 stop:1702 length:1176 start_codon:yes stop_codon:yes gene_type:complete